MGVTQGSDGFGRLKSQGVPVPPLEEGVLLSCLELVHQLQEDRVLMRNHER